MMDTLAEEKTLGVDGRTVRHANEEEFRRNQRRNWRLTAAMGNLLLPDY